MEKSSKQILTKGLLKGYVGESVRGQTERSSFSLSTSDYKGEEGVYHDEWAADFNGGGQELTVSSNGEKATRVYAGGTLSADKLRILGITKKDVIGKLVSFVNDLKEGTRLDKNAHKNDGSWEYTYEVLESVKDIPLDLGKEEIKFNGTPVFIHFHIISPII